MNSEHETTIVFNEGEDTATVWSASPQFHRQMQRLGVEPSRVAPRTHGFSAWYAVPKTWVKVGPPRTLSFTPEQRAALAARLRALRQSRKSLALSLPSLGET